MIRDLVAGVDEGGKQRFAIRRRVLGKEVERSILDLRLCHFPGCHQVTQKAFEVVILVVERQPGHHETRRASPI